MSNANTEATEKNEVFDQNSYLGLKSNYLSPRIAAEIYQKERFTHKHFTYIFINLSEVLEHSW